MNKKIKLFTMVVLLGGLLFGGIKVSAVDSNEVDHLMTVSPPQQRIVLMPGDVYEGSILIANAANAKTDLKYSVSIGSFGLNKDENGKDDYNSTDVNTVTSYNEIMNWITLGKESGTVAPNEKDTLSYTIRVPEDAPAGGQYATILIRDDTKKDTESSGNVMIQDVVEFAASIFAEVAGETRNEGTIIENSIPAFIFTNKLSTTATVRNEGNVHTDASFILQVWPLFSDEEVCTNEEEPTTSTIMPETERLHVEECDLPGIGIYKVRQIATIFGETSEAERMVIYCPLWLLFIVVFAIVLIVIWVVARIKARRRED